MRPARRALLFPLALAAALAVPMVWASGRVVERMGVDRPYDVRYIPDGKPLQFLPPGVKLSIADSYWMATVQYVGDQHMARGRFERLFPLVDLITDLDPAHGYAYQTAGIILSSAGRLEESDRILVKGMDRGPNWWSYPFYVAYNAYFYRGDYAEAARWAERAARTPGASTNISQLALSLKVKSGDPDSAVGFLEEMRKTARDERSADVLDEQYRLAVLQRDFARIDAALARFRERHGRAPSGLEELVRRGLLAAIPPEPFGGRYQLGEDGFTHSSARDFRFRPAEAPRPVPGQTPPPMLQRPAAPAGKAGP